MKYPKVVILSLLLLTLLTSTCHVTLGATAEERRIKIIECLGLRVTIVAPYYVDPGENITVTARAEPFADISVEYIYVNIYGLKNETVEVLLANFTLVENPNQKLPQEVSSIVTIPNDTSPGLTYGVLEWKWTFMGVVTITAPPSGFIVTYVRNTEFEQLKTAYDKLNATYTDLNSKYAGELGGARNLMYVFVATTIIAVATVLILILRRPKTFWS